LSWRRYKVAHDLTSYGTVSKNLLYSADAWLILVEMDATALGGVKYRHTSDNNLVVWKGSFYYPIAISFGDVVESLQGGLPTIDMKVSNIDATFNAALNRCDGFRRALVTVYVVSSGNLAAGVAEITDVFTVVSTTADNQWATFTLGYADPLNKRFPRDRYTAATCRHQYRITAGEVTRFCRYAGPEPEGQTTCNHTLVHCTDRGNTAQFGGSPGVDEGVYQ
jgi:phage-related protein